jgi:hypothetical protein
MSVSHQPFATEDTHIRAGIRHIHRFLLPLAQRRTYVETADLLLDLLFGVTWFSIFTTLIATGASLLITIVGLPLLTATHYLARTGAALERRRARIFLNSAIPEPVYDPRPGTVLQRLLAPFRDATTRNHLAYIWLVQPAQGIINFTVTVTVCLPLVRRL